MMGNDRAIASLKEKIDGLNQLAWEVRVNDSPKAFQLSEESVKLARSINYTKGIAEGLRSLGFGYVRLFKNEEAAPLLREALSLFQSLNDIKGQAVVYEYLGIIERNWGNLGTSLELLLKGYALIQQVDSLEIEVTSCYQIGVTYKHLGNHENALDYLYKALSIAKSSRNILMEAYATNIIGSIYFDNGDYNHALDCYQRGLVIRSESNDKWGEAGSLDNIGFTYLKLKDLDKAIDYCKQSLAISQSTGDKKGEANALLHLAEIYEQAGNIRQASKFSNESLEIRKARGDRRGETEALLFLAGLHKNSKDTENNQIFEWLSGALKIAQEIKAQDLLSKAYYDLHEYYTQNGNFKESLTHLEAHLQIEKELHKNTINQKISNLEISHKAETISQRNKELTELNAKIEKANEELKVEASLERVRAVAMGMKEPADMINVCRMISDQLLQLGFKEIRNVQTAIIYPQKHEYLNYQYFTPYDKESIETIDYRLHPDVLEFSNLMLSSTDAYYTKTFEGKELEDWREYRRQTNQLPDPKLDATTSSHYYFYSIGSGALGVTTYAPLNDGQIKLFKRFRNVFELAYRRFIDIEKAVAQAREAQIEAALERVRAKSMAMHHSDDLITVINIVQEQLLGLGFHFHAANFVTDYSEKGYTMWLASPGESFPSKIYVPQVGLKYFEAVNAAIEKGSDFATYTLNFEEKNIYFRNLFESSLAKSTSEEGKRKVNESKGMASSVVLLDKVRLNLMNLDLIPFTDEENNILRRFGYVFEQSYTRFLDLQKAEAQAREAQTEVALERIRARAMAMHSSNELMDVAHILREQMGLLDQPDLETSVVNLFDEDSDFIHSWHAFREPGSSSGKTINGTVSFRKDSSELTKEMIGHYHSGKKEYTLEATGEKLNEFLQVLINAQPEISNYIGKNPPEKVYYHFATFTGGALLTVSYQPTTEDIKILQRRAASVFDLAYRRYLDLKKAEAQTREAQIEVAVERVRAKALAMHQSVEIMGVAVTMRKELESLNIPGFDAVTITLRQDDGTIRLWDNTSAKQHEDGTWENTEWIFRLEENNPDFYINRIWDSDKKYFVEEQDENDLLITIDMVRKFDRSMADVVEHHFKENGIKHVWHPTVQLTHGKLNLDFYGAPAPEVETILLKMGAAFDLAYKRFLDLKNAEAQTREAQIQLALERVRARTMAMHHSDELTEVVKMLYQEFDKLKLSNESTDIEIGLIDEETGNAKVWAHLYLSDGTISTFNFPFAHFDQINDEFKRWNSTPVEKRNELFITTEFSGDLWEKFKTLAAEVPELVEMFNSLIAANITKWVTHNAYFSHGLLTLQGTEHYSQETQEIQKRFAKVFEQTYTRFLDLKKAEAQAREAQIETGLERVRSKTMAMHKSEEVTGVAVSLNEELLKLGFEGGSTILIINRETGDTEQWTGFSEDKSIKSCYVPFFKHPYHAALMDSWKKGEHFLVYTIAGDEKRSLDEHYFTTGYKIFPESDKKWMQEMRSVTFSHAFMKYGAIHWGPGHLTEEQLRILQRFSKVFEQSYTRFLDLQKAEAQAREAQIEASLERVRARTMGMRNSNELAEVAKLLFEQVKQLGVETYTSGFNIWDNKHENLISWMSNPRGVINPPFEMPIHSYDQHKRKYEAWQKNELFMEEDLKEEALANHYKFLRSFPLLDEAFRRSEEAGIKTPDRQVHNNAYFSNGYLLFITLKSCPEAHDIFKRFAKVFDQTYTRFLDLQKAEAQARDAQIEVALERVRAKVMAMTNSKELNATSLVFGEQLRKLNIDWQFSYFWLVDESKNENVFWITWPDCKTSFTSYTMAEAEEYFNDCLVSWRAGIKIHDNYVPPEDVQAWLDTFQRIADDAGGEAKKIMVPQTFANGVYYYDAMMKYGSFGICISKPATEEEKNIQCRFAIEFERAYTRFLDLKQAEAQAREAQIELGLERVRARAMAMQNSGELNDLVAILFEELTRLDLILARCIIWIFDIDTLSARLWMANSEDKKPAESYYIKRLPHSYYESIIRGWKERNPKWVYDLKGDEKKTIDKLLLNETELSRLPDAVKNGILNAAHTVVSGSFNNFGLLEASGPVELSGEQMDIVSRFAKVFDLTYTRFNDLKQAEAQAREAQIELGLERVRARAMAMQKSGELKELIATVSTELSKLDIILDRCFIMTYDIKTLGVTWWMANPETSSDPIGLYVKYHEQVPYLAFLKAWQDRIVKWQFILEGSVKKTWDEFLFVETELSRLPGFVIDNMRANDKVYLSASFNNFGCLTLATLQPLSDEQFDIMLRFAKVFDLTYTRFNDLKQAEAQAREAQIELGLEKVRAKAMAMHKSDDLKAAVATVFEELDKLELGLIRCGIAILDKDQPRGDIWITLKSGQHSTIEVSGDEPLDIHPLLKGAYDGWLKQEDFSYTLQDEDLVSYYQAITKTNFQESVSATFKTEKKDQQQYYFNAVFQDGSIFAFLNTAFTDEAKIVMRRFANVFNLTYKRFLDLQKAEAQAREARIETALEKVRASTMAMQRSEDLSQTAFVLFKQFKELGEAPERIFIATFDDHDSGVVDLWGTDQGGNQLNKLFKLPVNEPTMVSKIIAAWKEKKRSVVVDLKGEELKTYLGFLKQAGIPVTEGVMSDRRVQTAACFSNGVIGVTTSEPQSAEAVQLQERFAGVFDLTYTRFLDLQKAEAQAREAKIETALERVRARALAMQEPEELKEVAQVLRTEMGLLGVEELETCSIYINDESAEKAECWYALKDIRAEEKKLVNDHFALNLNDTWVGREMLQFYRSAQKQISIVMQGENRKEWIHYCEKHSTPLGGYYGEMIPDRTYHLYKFSHGAIGAAAAGDISEESWRMLKRAASVFSLAYSRFKDLTQARTDLIKLKEEKKRAEEALTELQVTQKQLIQSEKMASLGELTAGIAHEIQNPLNFVNNFSDVSNELLEEMKSELEKGNAEEAKAIAVNVKENLEKILHHGKRADAIVKGMLQHSRSSSGQKELTDINTLAEEYLRLAYHGLRAKDKFFHAKFQTDFDPSISKINIVPQEIGRVILNLINNSFYAVSEKKLNVSNGYEPCVTISTKKVNDKVEIRVIDNGNGIPQKVLDKIFQPFFTTKPTGQGTGLGLSLSYDIITKGHDGDIKVETKEGEGSKFIISLPVK